MSIKRKCDELNRDIHIKIYQNNFLDKGNDYERAFTSLDVIEDCQDAFEEFINIPAKNIPKRTTLFVYGVLQAMYCQQDGLFHLYRTLVDNKTKKVNQLFERFELDSEIRIVRDDIAGHPADRNYGKEFYYLAKGANSKYNFTYAGYNPNFKSVNVDLKEFIEKQTLFAHKVLDFVKKHILQKLKEFKSKFNKVKLVDIIKDTDGSVQLISRGIANDYHLASVGVKSMTEKLDSLKSELKKRYNSESNVYYDDVFELTDHILNKIAEWIKTGRIENNIEARIYMSSLESQLADLMNCLEELDKEFAE
jgi:Ni,Fe-hydrogenase I large subunit